MILVGIACQINMFPMYNNLANASNELGMQVVSKSVFVASFIYLLVGVLGLFLFGSGIKDSVLNNVGKEKDLWESYLVRVLYDVLIACHIPFIAFTGKESLLIIFDEYYRKSLSRSFVETMK